MPTKTDERLEAVENALGGVMQETSALRRDVDDLKSTSNELARRLDLLTPMVTGIAASQSEIRLGLGELVAGQEIERAILTKVDALTALVEAVRAEQHPCRLPNCRNGGENA